MTSPRSHAEDNAGLIPFRSRRMVSRATKFVGIDLLHGVAKNARKRELGGRMRLMISGGGALDQEIVSFFDLHGNRCALGIRHDKSLSAVAAGPDQVAKMQKPNAAGYLLPGTSLKIVNRDRGGIGEIPGERAGHHDRGDQEETKRVLRDGWFHTETWDTSMMIISSI